MTGRPVRVIFTKWGGGRHWEFDNVVLGRDERGTWLGGPAGRVMTRPGTTVTLRHDSVLLVPDGQPYAATLNRAGDVVPGCAVYVDVTTPAQWGEGAGVGVVRLVDLDLDVVRRWDGSVLVEDEDEFAEHQVALGTRQRSSPWPSAPATRSVARWRRESRRTTAAARCGWTGSPIG